MNTGDSNSCYHAATSTKPAQSSAKPKRAYKKSGYTKALRERYRTDLAKIDGRTELGRKLKEWRESLIADLGGAGVVSVQQEALVDLATKSKLLLDSVDGWLLQQGSLINQRKRSVYPIVLQRQQLADGLARYLSQLGLERRQRPAVSLQDLLAAPQANDQSAA